MSGIELIRDFVRWLREVESNLGSANAPREALGLHDGSPIIMQHDGRDFSNHRLAKSGDKFPIYLNENSVLNTVIQVSSEVATYGPSAVRLEATKACPFPLEDGAFSLAPTRNAWTETGADWTLVAIPRQRIDDIKAKLTAVGARPGQGFALVDGEAVMLGEAPRSRSTIACGLIATVAAILAAISVNYGASEIETAAQSRLNMARIELDAAEAKAADALERRETAAGPLRQAQIVGAALDRTPSVVGRLAALSTATPDDAFLKRLNIRPDSISGEFVSPDAAALAVKIGGDPAFVSARLKGSARAEADTQQRATLDILPRSGE